MTTPVEHVKENKIMYIVSSAIVAVLTGGGFVVETPFQENGKAIQEMKLEIAQTYQQREQQWQQQNEYHRIREIENIDWKIKSISSEINRIGQIPKYLNRGLSSEETWQIEQLKIQWNLLQQRRSEISN